MSNIVVRFIRTITGRCPNCGQKLCCIDYEGYGYTLWYCPKCDGELENDYIKDNKSVNNNNEVIIKSPNGVVITVDKNNINDFIMSDDEVSKVVEELKREIINKEGKDVSANERINKLNNNNNSEIEYIKKNFAKLSVEGLINSKEGINKNNNRNNESSMNDFIISNDNAFKIMEKLNREPINKNSKYASAREGVDEEK